MPSTKVYDIALLQVPGIGSGTARSLLRKFGSAKEVFEANPQKLLSTEGIGSVTVEAIRSFKDFSKAEQEVEFALRNNIKILSLNEEGFPKKLRHNNEIQPVLFLKGNVNLNAPRVISIVGTRLNTEYGRLACEKIIEGFAATGATIVSGLAYGIDTIAHKAALKNGLPTIAAVGHGLHTVYPGQNKNLASEMQEAGGLMTPFTSGTKPDKANFPERNKLVAAICDALIVVESSVTGGSLITANYAITYKKDVYAIPGRISDTKSEGCNMLIKNGKAKLITSASDIIEAQQWNMENTEPKKQRQLFVELTHNEKIIVEILGSENQLHIDELSLRAGLSNSDIAQALLMLEMQAMITSMPGKVYKLN